MKFNFYFLTVLSVVVFQVGCSNPKDDIPNRNTIIIEKEVKNKNLDDHNITVEMSQVEGIPVSTKVRVSSTVALEKLYENLTDSQKKFAFHLSKAGRAGRDIVFYQSHRHSLTLKEIFLKITQTKEALTDLQAYFGKDGYAQLIAYIARFLDQGGPYLTSNRKLLLTDVDAEKLKNTLLTYGAGKTSEASINEMVKLMTDFHYESMRYPENPNGVGLELTGGNIYEKGITADDMKDAMAAGLKSDLNCRIERNKSGKLFCNVQALNNPSLDKRIRRALTRVVKQLRLARNFANTAHQKDQLTYLIRYFERGDTNDFSEMNKEWVKDRTDSPIDFMMGYVEVYEDFLGQIGGWSSMMLLVDPETTKVSHNLAQYAQKFEAEMPYGQWKKEFPADYSPPALMAYYFEEIASMRSGGFNLPNYDDIRKTLGFKNVIRLSLPGASHDPAGLKVKREMHEAFVLKDKVDQMVEHDSDYYKIIALLHEIIGHGSGTYNEKKYEDAAGKNSDPISVLGSLGSALEEQRAELAALTFTDHPYLVEVGIYKSQQEATETRNAIYDYYVGDFLRRLSRNRTFAEAHSRGHWLFINQLLERDAIEYAAKDGSSQWTLDNFTLRVKDYELFHTVAKDLLAKLQDIKAEMKIDELKDFFAKSAPLAAVDEPWAKAIIERGKNLIVNAGSVEQSWKITRDKNKFTLKSYEVPTGKSYTETLTEIAPDWSKVFRY